MLTGDGKEDKFLTMEREGIAWTGDTVVDSVGLDVVAEIIVFVTEIVFAVLEFGLEGRATPSGIREAATIGTVNFAFDWSFFLGGWFFFRLFLGFFFRFFFGDRFFLFLGFGVVNDDSDVLRSFVLFAKFVADDFANFFFAKALFFGPVLSGRDEMQHGQEQVHAEQSEGDGVDDATRSSSQSRVHKRVDAPHDERCGNAVYE